MARKKNSDVSSPSLTLGTTEDTQIINSADIEAQEADLINDSDDSEEPKAAEKKNQDKEDSKLQEKTAEASETKPEENKPKRQRRSRKTVTAESIVENNAQSPSLDLSQEVILAKETVEITMNTMVAQFSTIKELTAHVNTQLERMNLLIKDMSPTQSSNLEDLVKPPVNSQFITKFATAASLVAVLVSLLSMSMSQSARQTLLSASLNQNKETSSAQAASSIRESSNEIAFSGKEFLAKKKAKK